MVIGEGKIGHLLGASSLSATAADAAPALTSGASAATSRSRSLVICGGMVRAANGKREVGSGDDGANDSTVPAESKGTINDFIGTSRDFVRAMDEEMRMWIVRSEEPCAAGM